MQKKICYLLFEPTKFDNIVDVIHTSKTNLAKQKTETHSKTYDKNQMDTETVSVHDDNDSIKSSSMEEPRDQDNDGNEDSSAHIAEFVTLNMFGQNVPTDEEDSNDGDDINLYCTEKMFPDKFFNS